MTQGSFEQFRQRIEVQGSVEQLRQRADYTYKFNANAHRHGWLRLTPAYSARVVDGIVAANREAKRILDPFCGTGTTALSAVKHGRDATTTDINPFLLWLTRCKTAQYSENVLRATAEAGDLAVELATREAIDPIAEPAIYNIDRWWSKERRRFLCRLKAAIVHLAGDTGPTSDLLHVAFCRTLVKLSNAAFNHQSMSFNDGTRDDCDVSLKASTTFVEDLDFVLNGAADNPEGCATAILADARDLPDHLDSKFDLVITSPPYANRMSYIRELRPYMYWLGWLASAQEAGEMDWVAIGGTWGIATSRLVEWMPSGNWWTPDSLSAVLSDIAQDGNKNGALLSKYVAKYCEDMSRHFDGLRRVLNPGARIHYIVGNSTFYGVLVPTERVYANIMSKYGFADVTVEAIRKRNSKKELIEFDVSATWPS